MARMQRNRNLLPKCSTKTKLEAWMRRAIAADDSHVPNVVGLQKRRALTTESKELDMMGRIHVDIYFQEKYLLNEVGIKIKGVIFEGQTTQTRLCSRTIVISENCLRSNRNVFEFCFTNNSNRFRSCFSCRERIQISICICIPRYIPVIDAFVTE